ncbi:PfkB family carbohydrate kinase [Oceaniglobus indicus]|uniref:PfkB family carbohydrate kinase n=1 Tax=Oceaniglobus indicus TaxID=2047749 RepID=UPI000C179C6E|nr:PfkB family carbohydrate kinase [Oceaniglobus indicus]
MTGRLFQMSGIVVDMVYRVDAVPTPGTEADVRSAGLSVGGGFNAMVAARRAGLDVMFAGTLGTGPLADMVRAALSAQGIAHIGAVHPGLDQGCCTVLVDDGGERTFIGLPGADGFVTAADLAGVNPAPGDWILQSGYALSYPNSGAALADWLRQRPVGARVVFDPGPRVAAIAPDILRAALGAALWISANGAEAAVLTGIDDPAEAARALARDRRQGGAVVRVGADGAWLAESGGAPRHIPGHPVKAIDTNGAGDAHIGYFIAGLAAGRPAHRALEAANIAAALSTTAEGPSTAPHPAEVDALLALSPDPTTQQGAET